MISTDSLLLTFTKVVLTHTNFVLGQQKILMFFWWFVGVFFGGRIYDTLGFFKKDSIKYFQVIPKAIASLGSKIPRAAGLLAALTLGYLKKRVLQ